MTTQDLIDRFCESRRRWLIVTAVTFVAALATVLPLTEQYLSIRADETEKTVELTEALRTRKQLEKLRMRVAETTDKLAAIEKQTIRGGDVASFRNRLIGLARDSGCQLRRIDIGSAARTRKWRDNDRALAEGQDDAGKETPFSLETRSVHLSVTGNNDDVQQLIQKIGEDRVLMHAKSVELRPIRRTGDVVQLDLELWCFALRRSKEKA